MTTTYQIWYANQLLVGGFTTQAAAALYARRIDDTSLDADVPFEIRASLPAQHLADYDLPAKADTAQGGQQLFAKIKRTSKYFGQTSEGVLFKVYVNDARNYAVQGGPGGQYRLDDVNLFVVVNGREVQIS